MKGQKYLSSKHRFTRQTSALLFRPPAGKPVCPDNAGNMRCLFINQTNTSSLLVFSQEVPRREQIFAFYFKVSESLERLTNLLKIIHQKHTTLLKMTPPLQNTTIIQCCLQQESQEPLNIKLFILPTHKPVRCRQDQSISPVTLSNMSLYLLIRFRDNK